MESFKKGRIDANTTFKMQRQILTDEIEDEEFLESAIDNFSEMMGYIVQGNLYFRRHRDISGEMWFGMGYFQKQKRGTQHYVRTSYPIIILRLTQKLDCFKY